MTTPNAPTPDSGEKPSVADWTSYGTCRTCKRGQAFCTCDVKPIRSVPGQPAAELAALKKTVFDTLAEVAAMEEAATQTFEGSDAEPSARQRVVAELTGMLEHRLNVAHPGPDSAGKDGENVTTPDGLKVYDSPHGLMVLAHEHNRSLSVPPAPATQTPRTAAKELWLGDILGRGENAIDVLAKLITEQQRLQRELAAAETQRSEAMNQRDHYAGVTQAAIESRERAEAQLADARRERDEAIKELSAITEAAKSLYYAGHWSCDRTCEEVKIWTNLKTALRLPDGASPIPIHTALDLRARLAAAEDDRGEKAIIIFEVTQALAGIASEHSHPAVQGVRSLRSDLAALQGELANLQRFYDLNIESWKDLQKRFDGMVEEKEKLKSELAKAREDTERLDWLEANLTRLIELDREETAWRMEYFTDKQEHLATTTRTIRSAINAALSAREGEKA